MQSVDKEVIQAIVEWLNSGKQCWLATVIETWGSSPRPKGSLLACNSESKLMGSLSGGCVEEDLLEKLVSGKLATNEAQYFQYGVTNEEAEKFGLPCGGNLDIVVEPHQPSKKTIQHFEQINLALQNRETIERTVNLASPSMSLKENVPYKNLTWDKSDQKLVHIYGPRQHLFIIGAGMVSKYLAEFALALEYHVTVCDPRSDFIEDFNIQGVQLVCDMPDDAVLEHADDESTAIVALTHDPRIDDMGLMVALDTEAFYVGAMGSKKTSASRMERLAALDVSSESLSRLHAPIGLPIGSKTPPEIAIAILAEITAVKTNTRDLTRNQMSSSTAS